MDYDVRTQLKDKLTRSEEEWSNLESSLHQGTMDIGLQNQKKNRYSNVVPYDETRVILPKRECSDNDYINANYVKLTEEFTIVLTQAPLHTTIDDFWWMIWSINTSTIGMFTNFIEGKRTKASLYWPLNVGDFIFVLDKKLKIENKGVKIYVDSVFTDLEVSFLNEGLVEKRSLTHFHYKGWPDFGTPGNTLDLIHYLKYVKGILRKDAINVFHCSAGCGRAGVMCAILRNMVTGESVPLIIETIRKDRKALVQTIEQYKFIHKVIRDLL